MPISAFLSFFRLRAWTLCLAVCTLVALSLPAPVRAQLQLHFGTAASPSLSDTVTTPHVKAQLVALAPAGIAPGQPLELGLRITHQPQWHTYWKNAGDSGLPTQLEWQLPAGIEAGEIDWPVPQQIRVADMLNYGYEGTVLLPVPAKVLPAFAPSADGSVDIQLQASWLVCRVECIPEQGAFRLRLLTDVPDTTWAAEFAAAHAQTPVTLPQASAAMTVLDSGDRVALRVQGLPAEAQGQTLAFYPEAAEAFVHAAVLGQDWSQRWEGETWLAELPLSDLRGATPDHIDMVLGLPAPGSDIAHVPPVQAWRLSATVQGQWQAAARAEVSPALAQALQANAQAAATPQPTAQVTATGMLTALVGGLLGGLLLNLMPCVFPVLAIKLMGLARHGAHVRELRRRPSRCAELCGAGWFAAGPARSG